MRKVDVSEELDGIGSIDEFLNVFTGENESDPNSFTAKVVSDSLDRLFPDEEKIRNLMMVSNVTNWQMVHIIKSLHSAYYMGLHEGTFGRPSVYEKRLKIVEDFLRLRASINARGRKDIVESLKAIMLNELQSDSSRIKRLLGKD
ncbi:hypothetical protein SDC9_117928 [bioreactor metagenome]|uniref:Uncharacterized protein n=1 Tax=bioreactor metagenome TaxID=1076179 RepID=A0A645C0B4_9ZZZZ